MNTHAVKAAAIALAIMSAPVAAEAAEVTLLISNALKTVFEELVPQFEKATGHKLAITFGSTNPLKARIEKGEAFDLTILGETAIDDLVKQGKLVATTRAVVARSGMGLAIRKGTPKPDIGTTETFKRTLLNAKSIGYLEGGLTGTYLKVLFQRLGIADSMQSKHKSTRGAEARQADAARALLKYLASPDAARVMKANGLEPPG